MKDKKTLKGSSFCSNLGERCFITQSWAYIHPVDNDSLFGKVLQTSTSEVSNIQVCVARELKASIKQKETKKKRQGIPEDMKQEVRFYVNKHRITTARKWASDCYKGYKFKRETVHNWRNLYWTQYVNKERTSTEKITFKCPGHPSIVSQELTQSWNSWLCNFQKNSHCSWNWSVAL